MANRFTFINQCSMVCSSFVKFKLSLPETKDADNPFLVGKPANITEGYRQWVAGCLPRLVWDDDEEYVSLFICLFDHDVSGHACATVPLLLQAFVLDDDADADAALPFRPRRTTPSFFRQYFGGHADDDLLGWPCFVKRSDLESLHATDGVVTIVCGILFLPDNDDTAVATTIPPSTMAADLGRLIDCRDSSDVSFLVGGEKFLAHRTVLAARSPVFRAELWGAMEESTMSCITLQDIDPPVFKILLRYMYADELPTMDEEGDLAATTELFRRVLAAADRYALDRLKLVCAQRLCDVLSVDTVSVTIACAEMHSCPELKKTCLDFFMEEKNFKKIVVTEGYLQLMQRFPSVIDEIKERI